MSDNATNTMTYLARTPLALSAQLLLEQRDLNEQDQRGARALLDARIHLFWQMCGRPGHLHRVVA